MLAALKYRWCHIGEKDDITHTHTQTHTCESTQMFMLIDNNKIKHSLQLRTIPRFSNTYTFLLSSVYQLFVPIVCWGVRQCFSVQRIADVAVVIVAVAATSNNSGVCVCVYTQ